jgi:hypothetical protein
MMKTHTTAILLIVCICAPWHQVTAEEGWKMEINLSKEVYLEGEPIWLDCWLTNISEDTLRTWGLCLQCFWCPKLLLVDNKGDTLPYTGLHRDVIHLPGTIPGFILRPQENDYDCYDLVESFHQKSSLFSFYQTILDPGEYRVKAKCKAAQSKELTFEVKPPAGEEAKAYQLLKDALNSVISRNDSLERQSLNQLLTRYPNSVYAPKACKHLRRWEEMLEKYPNSGFTKSAITYLTGETSGMSEEKKKEFYNRIIKEQPETRAAWFVKQKLSVLDRPD